MLEPAHENIRELVICGLVGRVEMGVGGAKLRQHRIDRRRQVLREPRRCGLRSEPSPLFLPVEAIEVGIVEAVAHELPDLIEVRWI